MNFDQSYFDSLYLKDPDPWRFRSSAYEKHKYAATLSALPSERYENALELGCSIGEFTRQLATRANKVTAVDTSIVALEDARQTCREMENIEFVPAHLPDGAWERPVDLVVLSEILYYIYLPEIERLASRLKRCARRADMVLVHWTGETNYPLGGDEATECFLRAMDGFDVNTTRSTRYRLDVLQPRAESHHVQGR